MTPLKGRWVKEFGGDVSKLPQGHRQGHFLEAPPGPAGRSARPREAGWNEKHVVVRNLRPIHEAAAALAWERKGRFLSVLPTAPAPTAGQSSLQLSSHHPLCLTIRNNLLCLMVPRAHVSKWNVP